MKVDKALADFWRGLAKVESRAMLIYAFNYTMLLSTPFLLGAADKKWGLFDARAANAGLLISISTVLGGFKVYRIMKDHYQARVMFNGWASVIESVGSFGKTAADSFRLGQLKIARETAEGKLAQRRKEDTAKKTKQ